jgi:DNA-binding NarL/FixJ family response regulator
MAVFRTGLAAALACYHLGEAETAVKPRGLLEPYADRMQALPMVAMSREGQARALLALGRPGDRQQAAALLYEVAATARTFGSIFAKLGVANRAEAAAYATRRGLAG